MPRVHRIPSAPLTRSSLAAAAGLVVILLLAVGATMAKASIYEGPTSMIAWQSSSGQLRLLEPGPYNTSAGRWWEFGWGLAHGTSPSIAGNTTENESAITARAVFSAEGSHDLWKAWVYNGESTTWEMAEGASPSVAYSESPGEPWGYAFRANNGNLWCQHGTVYGVEPVSNPSVTWVPSGGGGGEFVAAFIGAGTHHLWIYHCGSGVATETGYQVASYTSPSIVSTGSPGVYAIAFHALGTNHLWIYPSVGGAVETGYGIAAYTSPSIAPIPGGFEAAFQAEGTGHLWVYNSGKNAGTDTGFGMAPGTSPSIARRGYQGYWQAAFEANTDELWTYSSSAGGRNEGFQMAPGTNPSIAP